ncbi:hypothetical protein BST12_05945 [Mycobacterium angelicum]|uniref:Uncharacterized protein n=1 Tax=Mycobacterium angelicum TaxID=470074 RepID=A0A1X0A2L8_MYCAN|nr:hypothetical protein BST12_05945 [Mycobacterium angelicum]
MIGQVCRRLTQQAGSPEQRSGDRERGGAGRCGSPPSAPAATASAAEPGAAGRRHGQSRL